MSFIKENIKRALLKDIVESGDWMLYFWTLEEAFEEIQEEGVLQAVDRYLEEQEAQT